jgi:vacuolar-type H+-ATPase subunit I/STV1
MKKYMLIVLVFTLFVGSCEDPINNKIDELNDAIDQNTKELDKLIEKKDSIKGKVTDYTLDAKDTLQRSKDKTVNGLIENALEQ